MPTILIVDDDPDFVEITRLILQSEGYTVTTASCGEMVLDTMRADPPDAVLLDVMMNAVLEGVHVANEMRSDERLRDIPVIMVSSIARSSMADVIPSDQHLPECAWITKPVSPRELLDRLARATLG